MYRCYRRQRQLSNHGLRTGNEAKQYTPGEGLLLALLTVAPRHGLHMAQEKAEYKQQGWVSQRNVDCSPWAAGKPAYSPPPLGNPTCTCTALNRNILAKFISLPSSPASHNLHYLLSVFARLPPLGEWCSIGHLHFTWLVEMGLRHLCVPQSASQAIRFRGAPRLRRESTHIMCRLYDPSVGGCFWT